MDIMKKLFFLLTDIFKSQFLIHGVYLVAYDASLIAKSSKKIIDIQKLKNHSGNTDAGQYFIVYHWWILRIIGKFLNNYFLCSSLMFRLIICKPIPLKQ